MTVTMFSLAGNCLPAMATILVSSCNCARYYDHYRQQLGLSNFGPINQDRIAVQQIKEQKAFALIQQGRISDAVTACCNIWASLPGAGYGQRENAIANLLAAYSKAQAAYT